ncbi:hypothetical protein Tco_0265123 [Tanacetum coccineum]
MYNRKEQVNEKSYVGLKRFEVKDSCRLNSASSKRFNHRVTSSEMKTSSGIVQMQRLITEIGGAHYSYMERFRRSHLNESVLLVAIGTGKNHDENDVFANKANASLTQELKECKTNLDESSRALGEATSSRDSSLIALQTKQNELEKYTALNDLTSDYKLLQTKLNETLRLLALKDIDMKEGLKTKTNEISVVNTETR